MSQTKQLLFCLLSLFCLTLLTSSSLPVQEIALPNPPAGQTVDKLPVDRVKKQKKKVKKRRKTTKRPKHQGQTEPVVALVFGIMGLIATSAIALGHLILIFPCSTGTCTYPIALFMIVAGIAAAFGLVGLIFGAIALTSRQRRRVPKELGDGRQAARLGLILASIALGVAFFYFFIYLLVVLAF